MSNSREFRELIRIGFSSETIDKLKVFIGNYKDQDFSIYIDPMDYYFNTEFSIVFVTSYEKISDDTFKNLNDKYYNRLKSLLLNTEYVFFDKDSAQFRYSISPYRKSTGQLIKYLDRISDILKNEKIKTAKIENLKKSMAKHY